jgi:hypothetical protein
VKCAEHGKEKVFTPARGIVCRTCSRPVELAATEARIEELEGHRKQWRRIAANYHDVAMRALRALEIHDAELAEQLRSTLTTETPCASQERKP